MFERFTDRARKVMQLANQEAQRYNHEYIGTEHILLGLCKEGHSGSGGIAHAVLYNLGATPEAVRLEVDKLIQSGPDMVTMGKLPQTPRAKKVIEYAMEESRTLAHNYVGTEHILLGLAREPEGVAAQVLLNLGLSADKIRAEVLNLMGDSAIPPSHVYPLITLVPTLDDHERRVREMMVGFGQNIPLQPVIPDAATRILRVRLLLEEVLELAEASGVHVALRNHRQDTPGVDEHTEVQFDQLAFYEEAGKRPNLPEMVDAVADISVVNMGAAAAYGVRMKPILELVDANNLMKIANGRIDEHGKFIKSPTHPKPNLALALLLQGWKGAHEQ